MSGAVMVERDDDGWVRRQLTDRDRAEEASASYRELGFEVELRAPDPSQFGSACAGCQALACRDYVLVYTRRATKGETTKGETP